jgi:hypothetical protein
MTHSPRLAVLVAAFGSATAMALTLLHYAQSHRAAAPGGYLAWMLCAAFVGLLCGAGSHWAAPLDRRSGPTAIAIGALGAFLTAILLLATLVWTYGS